MRARRFLQPSRALGEALRSTVPFRLAAMPGVGPVRFLCLSAVVLVALLLTVACNGTGQHSPESAGAEPPPARIVSMAPSVTEVLFALDLGDRVVGVTRYCDTPEEAKSKAQVGGYLDPNYEAIVALRPDLVVLIRDHEEVAHRLDGLGVASLLVDHNDVDGILESVVTIAETCRVADRGRTLAAEIRGQLSEVSRRVAGFDPPRVLVVVGRDAGHGAVGALWGAGPGSYFADVITMAGGVNACRSEVASYPELSREGLIHMDPDVIIDVVPELRRAGVAVEAARGDWMGLTELKAVRSGRVHVLDSDLMEIPGPRIAAAVDEVARVLHPEAYR